MSNTYATWNPLDKDPAITLSNGNLTANTASAWKSVRANIGFSTGKRVFQLLYNRGYYTALGFGDANFLLSSRIGATALSVGADPYGGCFYATGGITASGPTPPDAYYYMFALDLDAGKGWYAGGTSWVQGDPAAGTLPSFTWTPGATIFPACGMYDGSVPVVINSGASAFSSAPSIPAGFDPGWYMAASGALTGHVLRAGVPVVGATVGLYLRATGLYVASTTSGALGAFTFSLLDVEAEKYFVVALDPTGVQNAVIFDRLTAL